MIGFYNPASLDTSARPATIQFINAADGQIHDITMANGSHARIIAARLRDQSEHRITSLNNPLERRRGRVVFDQSGTGEGLLYPIDSDEDPTPCKATFAIDGEDAKGGPAVLLGAMDHQRGVFEIARLCLATPEAILEPVKRPSATTAP